MRKVLPVLALALVAAGCARSDKPAADAASAHTASRIATTRAAALSAVQTLRARLARGERYASLPDRGELLAYRDDVPVFRSLAYTWKAVSLSEAHALDAIGGTMTLTAPDGHLIRLRYDHHVEHADGNWTWVGRPAGAKPGVEAIITFGPKAVFGTIPDGTAQPLRLMAAEGRTWMVQTDAAAVATLPGANPTKPDAIPVPRAAARPLGDAPQPMAAGAPVSAAAGIAGGALVDVVLGYTNGFASRLGGQSQAVTRLTNMIDIANQAYQNSGMDGRVRLVATVQVNYADATDNDQALYDLTGYDCSGSSCVTRSVPTALQPLRSAREQYGADVVSLVRNFDNATNGSCGVGWILGGGQVPIDNSDAPWAMSVVSDSNGKGPGAFPSNGYVCRDETLAHEMGHNMGSTHDRATAQGSDGVLGSDEYGRYPYSFGYKAAPGQGNFYTVMAYGESNQDSYRIFSNPAISTCNGFPCGVADSADNARSLNQTMPIVAGFRATVVPLDTRPFAGAIRGMNGKCLDAANYGTGNGTVIQMWDCLGGSQQQWSFVTANASIKREATTKVLDVIGYGTTNGARLQLWDFLGGGNQRWYFNDAELVAAGGRVLDAVGASSANGTKLQLWDSTGGGNQRWSIRPDGTIRGRGGQCLDVAGFGTWNGVPVQLWACSGTANQKWSIGNGGTIVGYGGKCLEAANGDTGNGTQVRMWDCNGGRHQTWILKGEIRSVASDRCLDDPAAGQQNGSRVHIWDCHGGANQRWEFLSR